MHHLVAIILLHHVVYRIPYILVCPVPLLENIENCFNFFPMVGRNPHLHLVILHAFDTAFIILVHALFGHSYQGHTFRILYI